MISHEEVQSLLGAYALHGVDPDEADAISAHLLTCPRCQAEFDAFASITPVLGAGAGAPPAGLWEEIVATIDQAPPGGMVRELRREAQPRSPWARLGPALVAAAAAVVAVLAYSVVNLHGQVSNDNQALSSVSLQAPIRAALADRGHVDVDLAGAAGSTMTKVVVVPGGQAYVVSSTLPTLAPGRTYQLWAIASGRTVSMGLLGRRGSPAAFRIEGGTSALMVTAEPSGGVSHPTSAVVARTAATVTL